MATVTYFTDRSSAHQGLIGAKNYARQLIDFSRYNVISNDCVQAVNMAAGQFVTGIWIRVVSGAASATSFCVGDTVVASASRGFFSFEVAYAGSAYSGYLFYRGMPTNHSMLSLPVLSTGMSMPSYFKNHSCAKFYTSADTIDLFMQAGATDGTLEIIVEYLQTSDD
jgi:hypothetical protein